MRVAQVQQSFVRFCDDRIFPDTSAQAWGGQKPQVQFTLFGTPFVFDALKNQVLKMQARDVLVFSCARSLFHYAVEHDAMKRSDPLFRGERVQR